LTQACNPSYLGGRDWEDHSLRSAWAKSSPDPISTNKKLGVVVHACHSNYEVQIGGLLSRIAWA
jgi:hypothetical protein